MTSSEIRKAAASALSLGSPLSSAAPVPFDFQPIYTPDHIRAAEQPLLERMGLGLMRSAAFAVAMECLKVLRARRSCGSEPRAAGSRTSGSRLDGSHIYGRRVLVLAGSGGNGGDALFAAAELRHRGATVTVWQVGSTLHAEALAALTAVRAGGLQLRTSPTVSDVERADLIIDGMVGIGSTGGLRDKAAEAAKLIADADCPIVAVDIPSGVDPMTGTAKGPAISADVTVTFGALKPAHVLGWEHCGRVVIHGLGIDAELKRQFPEPWGYSVEGISAWPFPGPRDNKYSQGVVGIHAGSAKYPGAAILCTAGAQRARSGMVRYAGPCFEEVVRAHPEVVATATVEEAGRAQAWVTGPGAGELKLIDGPLLIDADAITDLAKSPDLQEELRTRDTFTLLTPHDGEYERLMGEPVGENRVGAAQQLARKFQCVVLLKGRVTVVTDGCKAFLIEAGSSWSATPGSGDVLAGIVGSAMAYKPSTSMVAVATRLHALAAQRSGPAPAGDIARAVTEVLRDAVAE